MEGTRRGRIHQLLLGEANHPLESLNPEGVQMGKSMVFLKVRQSEERSDENCTHLYLRTKHTHIPTTAKFSPVVPTLFAIRFVHRSPTITPPLSPLGPSFFEQLRSSSNPSSDRLSSGGSTRGTFKPRVCARDTGGVTEDGPRPGAFGRARWVPFSSGS